MSHIKQVPGWNEHLASDSEAVVKAEREVSPCGRAAPACLASQRWQPAPQSSLCVARARLPMPRFDGRWPVCSPCSAVAVSRLPHRRDAAADCGHSEGGLLAGRGKMERVSAAAFVPGQQAASVGAPPCQLHCPPCAALCRRRRRRMHLHRTSSPSLGRWAEPEAGRQAQAPKAPS